MKVNWAGKEQKKVRPATHGGFFSSVYRDQAKK